MRVSTIALATGLIGAMALPAAANLLINGSFEDGLNGWNVMHAAFGIDQYLPKPYNMDGNFHVGDQQGVARNDSNWQSVDVTGTVTLTGWLAGGDGGGYVYWVRLLDGVGVDNPLLCEFALYGFHNWTSFELNAVSNGTLTVEFGATGHDIYGPAAYHVDGLVLTPEPATLLLLCSGALWFLCRRRGRRGVGRPTPCSEALADPDEDSGLV
jgi:hypothetical protein